MSFAPYSVEVAVDLVGTEFLGIYSAWETVGPGDGKTVTSRLNTTTEH